MNDQWYYQVFGEEFGPMPLEELKQLADFGTIAATDKVRSAATVQWVAAASVAELGLQFNACDTEVVAGSTSRSDTDLSTVKRGTDEWFCKLGGQELGPLTFDDLIEYAEHEQLTADDEVKLGDHGKWRTVGSIGRLMAVIPYQAAEKTIVPTPLKPELRAIEQPQVDVGEDLSDLAQDSEAPSPACVRTDRRAVTKSKKVTPALSPRSINAVSQRRAEPLDSDAAAIAALSEPAEPIPNRRPTQNVPATQPASPEPRPLPYSSSTATTHQTPSSVTSSPIMPRPTTFPKKPSPIPARRSGPSFLTVLFDQLAGAKILGALGAITVVLLIVGWKFLPESKAGDIKRYHALKQIQDEIIAMHDNPAGREALKTKATQLGKEIADAVIKQASPSEPAKQCLLWAARDEIPRVFAGTPASQDLAEKKLAARLREAAIILGLESRAANRAGGQSGSTSR